MFPVHINSQAENAPATYFIFGSARLAQKRLDYRNGSGLVGRWRFLQIFRKRPYCIAIQRIAHNKVLRLTVVGNCGRFEEILIIWRCTTLNAAQRRLIDFKALGGLNLRQIAI